MMSADASDSPDSPDAVGDDLRDYNEKIVHCLKELRAQRDEVGLILSKQEEELNQLQLELERINYKISMIKRSMAQRIKMKENYDRTLEEAQKNYDKILEKSEFLLSTVQRDVMDLEGVMNKRVGTEVRTAPPLPPPQGPRRTKSQKSVRTAGENVPAASSEFITGLKLNSNNPLELLSREDEQGIIDLMQ